jgi:TMEM175 potassium channel family protein
MREYVRKEIAFERVLFFCDAVVAIAITLLALNLKLEIPAGQHLSFADLLLPWRTYVAFIMSFITIAGLWRTHHDFFIYINKMDQLMLYLNIGWLLFIVVLPFSTSVLSSHFGDTASVFLYSANIFLLSVFQNTIWDHADNKGFVNKEDREHEYFRNIRWILNLDMLNGLIAIIVCFYFPKTAFFLLFFKLPIFVVAAFFIGSKRRTEIRKRRAES